MFEKYVALFFLQLLGLLRDDSMINRALVVPETELGHVEVVVLNRVVSSESQKCLRGVSNFFLVELVVSTVY